MPNATTKRFKGVAMITAAPFTERGAIDVALYHKQIEHQIRAGVSIVQSPLADELYYLDDTECGIVMKTLADATKGKGLSCAIASHSANVEKIIENAKRYEDYGIDIIKLLSPLHFGLDFGPAEIYDYYAAVIESVSCPVMIYNQPRRCGANVSPAVVAKLANAYSQVQLVEDTNFAQVAELKSRIGDRVSIFVKFPFWIPASVLNCDGFYSWQPFAPAAIQELFLLCDAKNFEKASALFYEKYDLYSLSDFHGVAAMKYGLAAVGLAAGGVRRPVRPGLPTDAAARFDKVLARHGLSKSAH